jgi:hypothetical protein
MDPFNALAKAAETSLDGNQDPYIQLTILKKGETYRGVEITQDGLVGYGLLNTGYFHSTYEADVLMVYPGMFNSLQNEDVYAYNYVVEWQENGLPGRIQLAPYYYMDGVGGWNNTTSDDIVIIDFPGYNPKDLSIEVDYLGVLTDSQGQANAAITLTLGSDVTEAKAVVVSADADPDAVADAIAAGEMEATPIAAGYNFVPIEEGLSGKLMVVSVVLDEGAVKGLALNNFEYYGGAANPWEVAGIGNFVYTAFFGTEEEPFVDEGLELQYNAEEDVYRITHWGHDIDFTFMLDKEHEEMWVLLLDRAKHVKGRELVSTGGTAATVGDEKIILKHAITHLASSIILAHNHPSNNPRPSIQDDTLTQRVKRACDTLGIPLDDHIIMCRGNYYSYQVEGKI